MIRPENRKPEFKNLAAVLERKRPSRPTLFEFYLNPELERYIIGNAYRDGSYEEQFISRAAAFNAAGYDFSTIIAPGLFFPRKAAERHGSTLSLNEGGIIYDRKSFNDYKWPDPETTDYDMLRKVGETLPKGMKLIPFSADGVLENVIGIVGYDNLCYMLYEDRELVGDIFNEVGTRIIRYFEKCLESPYTGAIIQNDDWGFNTQTMLSTEDMRRFVFPYHREIAKLAHSKGIYTILHSCGKYDAVISDVLDMGIDARHSYEDKITPVEKAYAELKGRIAVLGGIDVDFIARSTPRDVAARCCSMLELAADGGFALGTGNSVPSYIPIENYLAMIKTVF